MGYSSSTPALARVFRIGIGQKLDRAIIAISEFYQTQHETKEKKGLIFPRVATASLTV